MKRGLRIAAAALTLGLAAAQLIRPNTAVPRAPAARSLWSDPGLDPKAAAILKRACADCHSQDTEWPWYSRVSPISWFVARHVMKGREKLNFSNWPAKPSPDELEEIYDSVSKKKMPLESYVMMHPRARLSQADRELLMNWLDARIEQASR